MRAGVPVEIWPGQICSWRRFFRRELSLSSNPLSSALLTRTKPPYSIIPLARYYMPHTASGIGNIALSSGYQVYVTVEDGLSGGFTGIHPNVKPLNSSIL